MTSPSDEGARSEEEKHVLILMAKARHELSEFCNSVLIVVSLGVGDDALIHIKTSGPPSHTRGLADYAIYRVEKAWEAMDREDQDEVL